MVATQSTMVTLGTQAPTFVLSDTEGKIVRLSDFSDAAAVLVIFMCNHCPYVIHIREKLVELVREYQAKGVAVVGINSNDVENYPEDSPSKMKEYAEQYGYTFPYLYDETQEIARAYDAACTPDFFLFDRDRKLVYRGQMDASRPKSDIPVTGEDVPSVQIPSMGCNIKWKS